MSPWAGKICPITAVIQIELLDIKDKKHHHAKKKNTEKSNKKGNPQLSQFFFHSLETLETSSFRLKCKEQLLLTLNSGSRSGSHLSLSSTFWSLSS